MGPELRDPQSTPLSGWRQGVHTGENVLVVGVLAAMVVLPLMEIVLRKFFKTGISNVSALVQHLTLLVAVLGGALAAREKRLLALSPISTLLPAKAQRAAAILSQGIAALICLFLAASGVQFVLAQYQLNSELAYGLRRWWVQMALPAGFAVVALRLIWHATPTTRLRLLTLLSAGIGAGLVMWSRTQPSSWETPFLLILAVATLLGAPVFTTLGGAALILFWSREEPIAIVASKYYSLVTHSVLPSIPLFTLAGYLLAEGGASKRIVRVFQALVGGLRGGPAIVTAMVCAFFTSFTGASGVTILALGGLLMPVLLAAKYSERTSLGLLTSAGSLGLLFPPCLPLILYVVVANTSAQADLTLKQMFLAGVGPGVLLVALTAWWGIRAGPPRSAPQPGFDAAEARAAVWQAKWELLVPVIALIALFSGWATPVEAAAVTAAYAFLTQVVISRDLKLWSDVPKVVAECGLLVGGVLLILGVALGFTHWLIDAQVPDFLVEWVTTRLSHKLVFLLLVNVFLLVVGCLMDIFSAIVVVVPLLAPIAVKFGVDPLHFGILFLANMELGYLTPPVGMNLFLSSYRFKKPMMEVIRSVLPILGVLLVGVLLITYIPSLSLALPRWFAR